MVNVGCDQLSKYIVRRNINYHQHISFFDNHFTLTKVENTGAFLSLGEQIPAAIKFILLALLPLIILTGGTAYLITKSKLEKIPLIAACCVLGGGIGNIYDRLFYGSVTDFMHISFGVLQTGIFNMADISVTVGVLLLLTWYYSKVQE